MTLAQVGYREQQMQQQWHDLVMAEQAGQEPEILEHMYNVYLQLAEEYNAWTDADQRQRQNRGKASSALRPNTFPRPTLSCQGNKQNTKKAS